ncbi:MAG: NAD-dependent epimerase/dehydratase family protein [Candidatus Aenigmarchaeota archaeon]|nr:NAD-dependent epimerase/dehydratase family protein [Candidatus Aenigmarchaeota archaeon]
MRVLVTGGAGFVGSNLAVSFAKGNEVVVMDNLKRRGSELNIPRLREAGVAFIHGDIRNKEDFDGFGKVDAIIECSAEPSVLAGLNSSAEYLINTNLLGTVNCLEFARKNNSKFIFLSSSRVYPIGKINSAAFDEKETRFELSKSQKMDGISRNGFTESLSLDGPRTLYGAAKLSSELIIREYVDMFGLQAVIDRCGLIAGPWQMGKVDQGVVALWVAKHHYKKQLSYIGYGGSGKQVRDILHIADLYRLIDIQLKHTEKYNGSVYNVGGGSANSASLAELTKLSEKHTGQKIPISRVSEERKGDIRIYVTDNSKVSKETGWSPKIGVEETIKDIAEWIKDNSVSLKTVLGD